MSRWTAHTRFSLNRLGPFMGLILIVLAGAALNGETFINLYNQLNVLGRVSIIALPAIGMTLVIIAGGIDLSVGSLVSFSSVMCAMLLMERTWTRATVIALPIFALFAGMVFYQVMTGMRGSGRPLRASAVLAGGLAAGAVYLFTHQAIASGYSTLMVLMMVPVVGLCLGSLNGIIIAKGRIQPFIVTLGMMSTAVGLAKFIAGKGGQIHAIYYDAAGYVAEGTTQTAPQSFDFLSSKIALFGVKLLPVAGLFFLLAALAVHLILTRLKFGRYIYAIGGNEETARLSGIPVTKIKTLVYALSGGLAALAGVLYCSAYTQGKPDAGLSWELDAIAAVVIGGTSLMGGKGSVVGTVIGVFIIGYLANILNLQEVPSEMQDMLKGVIIVGAVLLQEGTLARWAGNVLAKNN
jgi:ribose/xylose/arabinose/galactoside ABC-type transport system permease subunit